VIPPVSDRGVASPGPSAPARPSVFDSYRFDYDEVLNRGLAVSGEDSSFFARRRIEWLADCLDPLGERPASVMDYGCGHGSSAPLLQELLGARRVLGVEKSQGLLEAARDRHASDQIRFVSRDGFEPDGTLDLVFCNGVFHHIEPQDRSREVQFLLGALRPGGLLAFWENNPWNPGTRYVMSRIPFDQGSVPLSFLAGRRLLAAEGFSVLRADHLFLFPRWLKALRALEPHLRRLPLGAQYQLLCRKEPPA
jgi:SAM-dependent methyltransferase